MSRRVVANSLATTGATLANMAMVFFVSPVFVHAVGNSLYGMWELLLAIFGYLGVLDLGIKPAIVKYVAQYRARAAHAELRQLYLNALVFFGLLGVVICLFFALLPATPFFFPASPAAERSLLQTVSVLFGISVFFELPSAVFGGFLFGVQRHASVSALQTLITFIGNVVILAGLQLGLGLVLVVQVRVVANLVTTLALYRQLRASEIGDAANYQWSCLSWAPFRELVSFGSKNMVMMLATRLEKTTIPFIITHFVGVASIVFFLIPMKLIDTLTSVVDSFTLPFMPLFSEANELADRAHTRDLYFKVTRYLLILITPFFIGIWALGGDFIGIWMGREYGAQAALLLPFFVVGLIANSLNPFVNRLLVGTGRHGVAAKWNLITAVASLALSLALASRYGLPGIALSWCLACIFRSFQLTRAATDYLGVSQGHFYSKVVLPVLPTALVMAILCRYAQTLFPPTGYLHLLTIFCAAFLIFIVPTALFLVDREDLHRLLGKKLHNRGGLMTADPKKVLFLPGNTIHVKLFVPVARLLAANGHRVVFVSRDPQVPPEYRVGEAVAREGFPLLEYPGSYETDTTGTFPPLSLYVRVKKDIVTFVRDNPFDLAVFGHDTASHFERIFIAASNRAGRSTLLVQDSIRQSDRNLGLFTAPSIIDYARSSCFEMAACYKLINTCFKGWQSPYFKKPYGFAGCTAIAASGMSLKRALSAAGIDPSRIVVTGQPRFDGYAVGNRTGDAGSRVAPVGRKLLLFCRQELDISDEVQMSLLRDLIENCARVDNAFLVIKLHPRDPDAQHYIDRLRDVYDEKRCLVLRDYPLDLLLLEADGVMAVNSTTLLEAMLVGKPTGIIQYMPVPYKLAYDEIGAAIGVDGRAGLAQAVNTLLNDEPVRLQLVEKAKGVVEDELFRLDGKAAVRVAQLAEALLAGSVGGDHAP